MTGVDYRQAGAELAQLAAARQGLGELAEGEVLRRIAVLAGLAMRPQTRQCPGHHPEDTANAHSQHRRQPITTSDCDQRT